MFTALKLFKDMTSMQCKSESLLMSERIRFYLSSNIWLSHLNAFTKLALAAFISGWQVSEHREHTVLHTSESLLAVHPLCSISHSMEHMLTVPCTSPVCPAWGHLAAQPPPRFCSLQIQAQGNTEPLPASTQQDPCITASRKKGCACSCSAPQPQPQ